MIADTAGLVSGHLALADWFLLIAAVLFVVDVATVVLERTRPARGILTGVGFALLAVALLVI